MEYRSGWWTSLIELVSYWYHWNKKIRCVACNRLFSIEMRVPSLPYCSIPCSLSDES